jgi:type III secretory pathway component EscT
MPLKSFVGLLILMLAWAAIFNQLTVETTTWFKDIKNLIKTVPLFPITS